MTTCIIIPVELEHPLVRTELHSLHDYQTAVDGYIEGLTVSDPPMVLICDEEGRLKNKPMNRRATALWWLFGPQLAAGHVLVGTVVLVGASSEEGDATDVPPEVARLLIDSRRFTIRYRRNDSEADWTVRRGEYDNFFEAAMHAISVASKSPFELTVRVDAL